MPFCRFAQMPFCRDDFVGADLEPRILQALAKCEAKQARARTLLGAPGIATRSKDATAEDMAGGGGLQGIQSDL